MDDKRRDARRAGLWYLLMAVSGPIGILYAPSQIYVPGDVAATAANLVEHGTLLRVGVAASLVCQVAFVFLVLAVDKLFEGVHPRLAKLMLALVVAAVPIAIANEMLALAALTLVNTEGGSLSLGDRGELALVALDLHAQGISLLGLFWGLWLYPFGRLAMLSGFIPKILGVLLIVGCCAYVIDSTTALLVPAVHEAIVGVLMLPLAVGELSMVLWLLIKGVQDVPASGRTTP